MTTVRERTLFLPIQATGLGHPIVVLHGIAIMGIGALLSALVAIVSHQLNWWPIPLSDFLTDVVFLLVRIPAGSMSRSFQAIWKEVVLPGPLAVLGVVAALVFVWSANSHLAGVCEFMARRLSAGDRFPLARGRARRVCLPLTLLLLAAIMGGVALWAELLETADSLSLRIVRLVSLGVGVQFVCMLTGGAMASALAEGGASYSAIRRLAVLAWSERGHFLRAVVYTTPRWLGLILVSWVATVLVILLPFLLTHFALWLYLSFLAAPSGSRAVPIVVALIVVGGDYLLRSFLFLRAQKEPLNRWRERVVLAGAIWCLLVLPFLPVALQPPANSWFAPAALVILGGQAVSLPTQMLLALVPLAGLSVLLLLLLGGQLLLLYPLASGVCTFFLLRSAAEGHKYQLPSAAGGLLESLSTASGMTLFGSGGSTSSSSLSPPCGWQGLALAVFSPTSLIWGVAAGSVSIGLGWGATHLGKLPPLPIVLMALAAGVIWMPLLCRHFASTLAGRKGGRAGGVSAVRLLLGAWWRQARHMTDMSLDIVVVFSLGLIPWVGPLIWGIVCLLIVLRAALLILLLITAIPFALMLYPAVVLEDGPSPRASDIRNATVNRAVSPWGFIASLAMGLPVTLLPAAISAGALSAAELLIAPVAGQRWINGLQLLLPHIGHPSGVTWWEFGGSGIVLGLGLLGLSAAVTNAYLVICKKP